MSGLFYPVIKFPFSLEGARRSWLHLEPIATIHGYGILFKVILELTASTGKNSYIYERTIEEFCITQEQIIDHDMAEAFCEFIESFYFCKITQDLAIPVAAMFIRLHIPELLEKYDIDLSEYITEIITKENPKGFQGV